MKKKFVFYIFLLGSIPLIFFTGGVESPVRYVYYPLIVLLIPEFDSGAILRISLNFCILFAALPFASGAQAAGQYPIYPVGLNTVFFLIMAVIAGRISDFLRGERDAHAKATDTYHGLTNALNLKIMNLQSRVDSISEAYEGIQESNKNKTRFISDVSHEIRSPLSSIRSFSEILLDYDDIDEDTRKEFIGIINKESERLAGLTNEILDLVKMDSGKVQWHMDALDLGALIASAVKTMKPLAEDKGLAMATAIEGNVPPVRGDQNRLLQVMLNLLSNAIKFTHQGKITIGAGEEKKAVAVFVSDTGEGIYPAEREKIFEEFYRIGDDLAGRPRGSGLGLSISKKIIEAHGGRIWVESEPGRGSTFRFVLPRDEAVEVGEEESGALAGVAGRQVLILEDKAARQILRGLLERLGFRTFGAENVRTALELLRIRRPDAVLMGYPKSEEHFDELRTLSRIKGIPVFLALIINDGASGPQLAVNGYISRPPDMSQIKAALREVLPAEKGKIMIISTDAEEARSIQLLVGAKNYETFVVSEAAAAEAKTPPDAIIAGTALTDDVYRVVASLRGNPATRDIPILLALRIFIRDIKCIGLDSGGYGGGIGRLLSELREAP